MCSLLRYAEKQSSLSEYDSFTKKMVLKWPFLIDTGEDPAYSLFMSADTKNSLSQ